MRKKRSSSKFNKCVPFCLKDERMVRGAGAPVGPRHTASTASVVDLEHVVTLLQVVAADGLVVLGQPVGQRTDHDPGDVTPELGWDAGEGEVGDVDVLRLLAVCVQKGLAALG